MSACSTFGAYASTSASTGASGASDRTAPPTGRDEIFRLLVRGGGDAGAASAAKRLRRPPSFFFLGAVVRPPGGRRRGDRAQRELEEMHVLRLRWRRLRACC